MPSRAMPCAAAFTEVRHRRRNRVRRPGARCDAVSALTIASKRFSPSRVPSSAPAWSRSGSACRVPARTARPPEARAGRQHRDEVRRAERVDRVGPEIEVPAVELVPALAVQLLRIRFVVGVGHAHAANALSASIFVDGKARRSCWRTRSPSVLIRPFGPRRRGPCHAHLATSPHRADGSACRRDTDVPDHAVTREVDGPLELGDRDLGHVHQHGRKRPARGVQLAGERVGEHVVRR